ncbi:response regulator [Marinobacterium weihaiense]|uniref:Response regulator n=1 Tax=Marinobacterium weihaiense TaxID=2851016 RepID=A0ABS6MAM3_9GAMM|nr:response regulator [Marinobacterium weihaiense]MBV0932944.1 response regulator [Marinobacterium weihaiense]
MFQVSNQDLCTSRKAAELLGVTPRTVQLWADDGILQSWKTPGGHRRFSLEAVHRLAEEIREGVGVPELRGRVGQRDQARVHVIEDDARLQRLYAMTLRSWGLPIELKQSTDGYQGLLELGAFEPDLLVLDINLPNMDGFSIIDALARQGVMERMELVVVTALNLGQVKSRVRNVHAGVNVLPKPIPFDQLRLHVEKILSR